jgi:hypothetical protein
MVTLVTVESQRGEAGYPPEQGWPLRITEVYRREGAEWCIATLIRPQKESAWNRVIDLAVAPG